MKASSPIDDSARAGTASFKGTDAEKPVGKGEFVPAPTFREDIGKGTWAAAGYHLATTIATPAAYAYLPFAFAGLGWAPGIICLLLGIAVTWYASILLASLHEHNGVRYVRYKDLAHSIAGKYASWAVVAFQQIASLGNNITLGIVAGISMKALNRSFSPDSTITLQQWIIVFGAIQLVLSQFPHIHDLRFLNLACTFCTAGFAVTATALSIYTGNQIRDDPTADPISYTVPGNRVAITFGVFSALGTIAFGFGDTVLPEVQATLKEPVKKGMFKAVHLCYFTIASTYLITTISGYWAFGNSVLPYLVSSFTSGPVWAVRLCNFFAIIQICGCYQIYCRPTYEVCEVWAMDVTKSPTTRRNIIGRFCVTTVYIVLLTFIGCLFPFFGDFLALAGAIGFTPLDFILPPLLWTWVNKPALPLKAFHYTIAAVYSVVGVLAAIGAVRFIIIDAVNFSVFADL